MVYAYDARGHGNSSGKPNFKQSLEDVKAVVDHLRTYGLPIFIAGHILGSVYALNYVQWAARNQFALRDFGISGLILASVPVKLYFPPDFIDIIKAFGRGIIGRPVPMPLLWPTELRQAMEGRVMLDDPLIRKEYPLNYLLAIKKASGRRLARLRLPRIPTLVLQSLDDENISSDKLPKIFRGVERRGEGASPDRPFLRTELLVDADHTLCNAFFPMMTGRHSPETTLAIFDNIYRWVDETLVKYQYKPGALAAKGDVGIPLTALASVADKLNFDIFCQAIERLAIDELAAFIALTGRRGYTIKKEYREYVKAKYLKFISDNLPEDVDEWDGQVCEGGAFGDVYLWGHTNDVLGIARELGVGGLKENPKFAHMASAMIANEISAAEAGSEFPFSLIPFAQWLIIKGEERRLRRIADRSVYKFLGADH